MHMRQKVHVGGSPQRRLILRITNNKRCIYFVQGEPEGLGPRLGGIDFGSPTACPFLVGLVRDRQNGHSRMGTAEWVR